MAVVACLSPSGLPLLAMGVAGKGRGLFFCPPVHLGAHTEHCTYALGWGTGWHLYWTRTKRGRLHNIALPLCPRLPFSLLSRLLPPISRPPAVRLPLPPCSRGFLFLASPPWFLPSLLPPLLVPFVSVSAGLMSLNIHRHGTLPPVCTDARTEQST